jgi:hypothetical protein
MEFVLSGANVTLFCTLAGDASLYTSKGFGVVGGIAHENVRSAALEFINLCEQCREDMTFVDLFPPPREGRFQVYALTEQGALGVEVADADLVTEGGLAAVRKAGHTVIAELRKISSS